MKAMIVINYASEEDIGRKTSISLRNEDNEWVEEVVIIPMPIKKPIELACQKEDTGNDYGAGLIVGWNDCLEALEDSQNGENSNE